MNDSFLRAAFDASPANSQHLFGRRRRSQTESRWQRLPQQSALGLATSQSEILVTTVTVCHCVTVYGEGDVGGELRKFPLGKIQASSNFSGYKPFVHLNQSILYCTRACFGGVILKSKRRGKSESHAPALKLLIHSQKGST